MGTDIHVIVEAKDDAGIWRHVSNPIKECWMCHGAITITFNDGQTRKCTYCNPIDQIQSNRDYVNTDSNDWYAIREITNWERVLEAKGSSGGWSVTEWYDNRNYNAFSVLANVRNGYGFAGVDTGDSWPYIQSGRELPEDACPEVIQYMSSYDHDAGWITLEEFTKYDWSVARNKRGMVDKSQYLEWLTKGAATGTGPHSWCGDVSGAMIRHVDNETMSGLIQGVCPVEVGKKYYTKVQWVQTARAACSDLIESMKELAGEVGERECRVHFYFDS
ncbi:MAG: hypothetical protein ABL876_00045 [Chitinophagaceae bacterium]